MNRLFRKILLPLPYLVRWYLSKKRVYQYEGLSIDVLPGVFHPGLFFSTKMLLRFAAKQTLQGRKVLEIGAGTGIISLYTRKMGAMVTATDISQTAVENIRLNAIKNNVSLTVVQSDLFEKIPSEKFDWVFVNPPYYPREPIREEDFAWYCGTQHEYFVRFFSHLPGFITMETTAVMVLSDVCDLATIIKIGKQHQFEFIQLAEEDIWLDGKNYVFQIKQTA